MRNFAYRIVFGLLIGWGSIASGQLVSHDFNDLSLGDLSGQQGGTGWDAVGAFTPNNGSLIDVVAGDLMAPAFTNYNLTQSGMGQHLLGTAGSVNYSRNLDTPTAADADIWFSMIMQMGDVDLSGDSGGRTGIVINSAANNSRRFLMRGITATGAGDPGVPDMEIFTLQGGRAPDYDVDFDPFLLVGRLQMNPAGADTISWWYNPDVTTLDRNIPDGSAAGNFDAGDGISLLGFQVYGADEGRLDAFNFSSGVNAYTDVTGQPLPPTIVSLWNVDADGNYGTGSNWDTGMVPGAGAVVRFGNVITEPRTVSIDIAADVSEMNFSSGGYTVADGGGSINLSGNATINTGANSTISANITGSNGLVKTGGSSLFLSGNNTYSGVTEVQGGLLRATNINSIPGDVNLNGGSLVFQGVPDENGDPTGTGFSGIFAGDITGTDTLILSDTLSTEVITFDSAKNFDGVIRISNGTLEISDPGALGSSGTEDNRTRAGFGGSDTGTLKLTGDIAINGELLDMAPRDNESPNLSSDGNNSWESLILGGTTAAGRNFNIESASGTLTLSNTIGVSDADETQYNLVFSGAGTTNVTGIITDDAVQTDGIRTTKINDNVNVVKKDSGTLVIATASNVVEDYWFGSTIVEEGTLEVVSGAGDVGELQSPNIQIQAGGTLDVSSFGTYNLQIDQNLGGGGTIVANTVGMFSDNQITPGDSVGTLNINGNLNFSGVGAAKAMVFEFGPTTAVGGSDNDLIDVSGNATFSGAGGQINVVANGGTLAAGSYTAIRAGSVTGTPTTTLSAQISDRQGNALNTRQTVGVSSTGTSVNVDVTGSAADIVWTGSTNAIWNVNTTANWTGPDNRFMDLDRVTFNDTGSTMNVTVSQDVAPGAVTLDQSGTYAFTGSGSIRSQGAVNLNSGTTVFANGSNEGQVTVAAGATLQGAGSGTDSGSWVGNVVNNGTFRIGDAGIDGDPPVVSTEDFESYGTGVVFENNATTGPSVAPWTFIDARSTTSTQTGNDDVVFSLDASPFTGSIALSQTNTNTDFPNTGSAHNGSMAIADFDTSGALDTITASLGQDDPSGAFADTSIVFGFVDQDNYFYAQITQGEGIAIRQVVNDSRSTIVELNDVGNFSNQEPWEITVNHNSATGTASLTVTDPSTGNSASINASDPALTQDGLIGFGSHNDSYFVDDITVTTSDPGAVSYAIDGDVTMTAGSSLEIDVQSAASFDRLVVSGNFEAAGALDFVADAGFVGTNGSTFDLLDAGTFSGQFDTLNLPNLMGNLVWDASNLLIDGTLSITQVTCDFDSDGDCDADDIDLLVMEVSGPAADLTFDLDGNGVVDTNDVLQWLSDAGNQNIGAAYLEADANLDGVVDGQDFILWNGAKFTATGKWSEGDFNADGFTDGQDFILWNQLKFQSSDALASVPEPSAAVLMILAVAGLIRSRRQ